MGELEEMKVEVFAQRQGTVVPARRNPVRSQLLPLSGASGAIHPPLVHLDDFGHFSPLLTTLLRLSKR